MPLSKRLSAIAKLVIPGAGVADIGTDHAYLPIYLVEHGVATHAIAGEVNQGPYLAAQDMIQRASLQSSISLRLGDGLAVLQPGEVETIVIAGMGATTMTDILNACPAVVQAAKRLVVQPMIGAALMRQWLTKHRWAICEEELIVEDDILYEIIAAEPGEMPVMNSLLYEIGPVLWRQKHPLLEYHMTQIIKQYKKIVENLKLSKTTEAAERCQRLVKKIEELEAWRTCL